ncbi:unnamed protein product [Lactuca virosa]|uniref:Maturase K n=1 Tax=Lactuca virosa TaxID=75947 RepID=A0AAU9P3Z1_9ASTR|nr:unnamed protein product [Lactuca virosa]
MVLPERRSQSQQLELLFNFYIYPFSPKLYNQIIQIGHLHTSPSKLRWIIDDYLHKWFFSFLRKNKTRRKNKDRHVDRIPCVI